ncbi:hypothetical protein NDU88_005523 [Pleurodeles waltl]|uniref:Uncharacterized protein n=1 Tax=Pleurodeles waltl TaxID=8319 RepID=A0AAV7VLR9_PLEWA|nr:hypothetical protein NDU88_005523 [Pleurodeles waltl]
MRTSLRRRLTQGTTSPPRATSGDYGPQTPYRTRACPPPLSPGPEETGLDVISPAPRDRLHPARAITCSRDEYANPGATYFRQCARH